MVRRKLGDPKAPFVLKKGDKVTAIRGDGQPDTHEFGRVVDGEYEGEDSGGPYKIVYEVEIDGRPNIVFSVGDHGYVRLTDEEFIRLRLRRQWREKSLPRQRPRVGQLLELGKPTTTAINVGTGSGEQCAACGEVILPSHAKVSYQLASGGLLYLHERCDRIWDELDFGG